MKKDCKKKMKITELNIPQKDRQLLMELEFPKTIAEIAARLDISYNYASTKLMVLKEKGWIKRTKVGKLSKYYLDRDRIEL
jgi:DNA-binding Lrp family transcriptional regulator